MMRRIFCIFLVFVIVLSFSGCGQIITDFLMSIRETKMDHPATGTYYNEELNIGIAFGVDEYCPVLLLPDGSSYILGVSTTGRFECWEFEFVAQFTWQPGDNFVSIKIVKYAGDYTPDKWYVLTPRG